MTIIQAVILGLVQGLCEFLPVSSSGHLLLLQTIFGITEGQTFFTVMLHLGTLLAVLIVYRKTILELLKHPFQKLTGYLLLATVPTVLIAVLFKKVPPFSSFYEKAEAGTYLGICFLITSALLIAADRVRARGKRVGDPELLHILRQPPRQLDRGLVREPAEHHVAHPLALAADCLDYRRVVVPVGDAPPARNRVHEAAPAGGLDLDAAGGLRQPDRRRILERSIGVPDAAAVVA